MILFSSTKKGLQRTVHHRGITQKILFGLNAAVHTGGICWALNTPPGLDDFSASYNKHGNPGLPQAPYEAELDLKLCDNAIPSPPFTLLAQAGPRTTRHRADEERGRKKNAKPEAKN